MKWVKIGDVVKLNQKIKVCGGELEVGGTSRNYGIETNLQNRVK